MSVGILELGPDAVLSSMNKWAFPISRKETPPSFGKEVSSLSAAAQDMIRSTNAYRGGNNGLWLLHELNIRDKHHMFVTVCYRADVNIGTYTIPEPGLVGYEFTPYDIATASQKKLLVKPETFYTFKPGSVIRIVTLPVSEFDPHKDYKGHLEFDIAVYDPELGVLGDSLLETLCKLTAAVKEVINRFDTVCFLPQVKAPAR